MKKNSSTAHNSKFSRVVCMLLVTVLLCGLGWTGIVASAESMQAGSAVSEQIAANMTEGAVETEQPAPTEAPEHMGELPTMDEALGLVAAPQGQTADGVYYFGEQTDTEGLYVKVEVIDKSEGAVLPEGAQLKLKASEKAAEYVRQSILKKAELADDEFFFLYDLSFVDKDGKVFMSMDNQFQLGDVFDDVTNQYGLDLSKLKGAFVADPMFGAPMQDLEDFLKIPDLERGKKLAELGIPLDSIDGGISEFQTWVKAARAANGDIKVAIKADSDTPYKTIKRVMNELQDINENRYYLITNLKTEED